MLKRMECKIIGKVQMVMFRDFVKKSADRLGVLGVVKNMKDGSVFVVAEGEEKNLHDLFGLLQIGPVSSEVKKVSTNWLEYSSEFSDFIIVW